LRNQESKLLALKILQCLSVFFSKLFDYITLGFITVVLIYVAKTNGVDLTEVGKYITAFIELLFVVVIGSLFIQFISYNKFVNNLCSKSAGLMIKSGYVLWLINIIKDTSTKSFSGPTSELFGALLIVLIAKMLFNFACNYYGNVLIDECIDLDYIKLKDYKVTDSFIAEEYKDIEVDNQSLSITKNGSDAVESAKGHVTFKVLKLPVKLDFVISPYMSGTLVSNEAQIRFETGERPLGIAKQIKKTIKI
jgi:hypothetical protein